MILTAQGLRTEYGWHMITNNYGNVGVVRKIFILLYRPNAERKNIALCSDI